MADIRFPTLGKKLTKLLKDKDLAKAAEAADITVEQLKRAAAGEQVPSFESLVALSKHLAASPRELTSILLDDMAVEGDDKPQAAAKKPPRYSPRTPINRW